MSYNNGNQAVVGIIDGTTITAVFGEDGSLTGSAGCNNYTTSYTVDGDAITIGPAASTRKMCVEPEGVMEQEMAYLTALTTAATYTYPGRSARAAHRRRHAGGLVPTADRFPIDRRQLGSSQLQP